MKWAISIVILLLVSVVIYLHLKKNQEIDSISPFQDNCSAYLESLLVSPGSLKVVKTHEGDWAGNQKEVSIEFDSQNQFGALLRGQIGCSYLPKLKWWEESPNDVDLTKSKTGFEAYELRPFKVRLNDETIGGDPNDGKEIRMISTPPMLLLMERDHERAKRKADLF